MNSKDAQSIVSQLVTQIPQKTQQATNQAIASASSLLSTIATFLFDASLVVIISFYMMLDGGRLIGSLCSKLPPSWEPDVRLFQGYINEIFGGFFRAQLTVAGIYAFLTWITTWIVLGFKSTTPGVGGGAFLAGFLAGIFMLLPFLGAFLAVIPPALLVVIQTPPDGLILKLVILIFALGAWQHVVLNVLAPRIYGHHLGMDPIILFAALLLGAKEGGIWARSSLPRSWPSAMPSSRRSMTALPAPIHSSRWRSGSTRLSPMMCPSRRPRVRGAPQMCRCAHGTRRDTPVLA